MGKQAFQSILNIAEAKEKTAACAFSDARVVFEDSHAKLEELLGFRDEYHERESAKNINSSQLNANRQFLIQLSDVIDIQETQVAQTRRLMQEGEGLWQQHRIKRRSIEVLSEKRQKKIADEADAREQKELDEIGNRLKSAFKSNQASKL